MTNATWLSASRQTQLDWLRSCIQAPDTDLNCLIPIISRLIKDNDKPRTRIPQDRQKIAIRLLTATA